MLKVLHFISTISHSVTLKRHLLSTRHSQDRKQSALQDKKPYQLIQAYEGNRAELHAHTESLAFRTADLIVERNARLCCSCRHLPVSLTSAVRWERMAEVLMDERGGSVKSC